MFHAILHISLDWIIFTPYQNHTQMLSDDLLSNKLEVNEQNIPFFEEIAKWGKFLSILGFIMAGLLAIVALAMPQLIVNAQFPQMMGAAAQGAAIGITIVYLAFAVLMIFPALYLYRHSVRMKTALAQTDQGLFNNSLENLKSMFKFYGIFCIVLLCIYALVFILAIVGVAAGM